ncbi:hypothetical protein Q3H58_005212 [Pseudomonas psychrotolerans]|nr:hypothetical protein [Pseudomonas psychrotolerans]
MNLVSQAHDRGETDARIPAERFQGTFRSMAEGVNAMVAGHLEDSRKAMACVKSFGEGDLSVTLERFPGKKAVINDNLEQVRGNIQRLVEDANQLSQAAMVGRLDARADAAAHQGDFRRIVAGINGTLDAIVAPLNEAMGVMGGLSQGDLSRTVQGDYQRPTAGTQELHQWHRRQAEPDHWRCPPLGRCPGQRLGGNLRYRPEHEPGQYRAGGLGRGDQCQRRRDVGLHRPEHRECQGHRRHGRQGCPRGA